jgi:hypothetical protein
MAQCSSASDPLMGLVLHAVLDFLAVKRTPARCLATQALPFCYLYLLNQPVLCTSPYVSLLTAMLCSHDIPPA